VEPIEQWNDAFSSVTDGHSEEFSEPEIISAPVSSASPVLPQLTKFSDIVVDPGTPCVVMAMARDVRA